MRSREELRAEAAARVAALRHNTGGTYVSVDRSYVSFKAPTLSRWERGMNTPRPGNMERLRWVTS